MARQVFDLPAPITRTASDLRFQFNLAIDPGLVSGGASGYRLREIYIQSYGDIYVAVGSSRTENPYWSGDELTAEWEQSAKALIVSVGGHELVIPGPNSPLVRADLRDPTEAYAWTLVGSRVAELRTFLTNVAALTGTPDFTAVLDDDQALEITGTIAGGLSGTLAGPVTLGHVPLRITGTIAGGLSGALSGTVTAELTLGEFNTVGRRTVVLALITAGERDDVYRDADNGDPAGTVHAGSDLELRPGQSITRIRIRRGGREFRLWDNPSGDALGGAGGFLHEGGAGADLNLTIQTRDAGEFTLPYQGGGPNFANFDESGHVADLHAIVEGIRFIVAFWRPHPPLDIEGPVAGGLDGTLSGEVMLMPVPAGDLTARARLGRPAAEVEAVPRPLTARPGIARLRISEGALPHPLTARAALGRPIGVVDPEPEALTARARLGRPVALVEPLPETLTARARLGRPVAEVEAIPAPIVVRARTARPIAEVEAVPGELTARATLDRPVAAVEAVPAPIAARARLDPPVVLVEADPAALAARARLGRPIALVDPVPREALAARARLGRPAGRVAGLDPAAAGTARETARSLAGRDQVFALEIEHPDITEPARIVADTAEHTVEGNRYIPLAFHARVPQSREGEVRNAVLRIDNVGEELMEWVDASDGGRGASMRVLRLIPPVADGDESVVAWEVEMSVGVAEVTNEYVTVSLTDEPIFGRPAVIMRHDPATSPGLF